MSSMYAVMSKGKWAKTPLLEIQYGLTTKDKPTEEKSMEKTIREAVNVAMSNWQKKNEGGKKEVEK